MTPKFWTSVYTYSTQSVAFTIKRVMVESAYAAYHLKREESPWPRGPSMSATLWFIEHLVSLLFCPDECAYVLDLVIMLKIPKRNNQQINSTSSVWGLAMQVLLCTFPNGVHCETDRKTIYIAKKRTSMAVQSVTEMTWLVSSSNIC